VPVNILDLVEKINDKTIRENEKNNYVLRLEATSAYISEALTKNAMTFSQNRKKTFR
jgi:hypothetical protein